MARDVSKLLVFQEADALVDRIYLGTQNISSEERYGLQAQIRRASISVPCNLVEGCTRRTTKDFLRFVELSIGSASEIRYLLRVAGRLSFVSPKTAADLSSCYSTIIRRLQKLITSLEHRP
jgi:four helix bundle protein